ncbi:MAG: hypothetical protein ACLPPF_10435 [Rhodomicrobium sp.]
MQEATANNPSLRRVILALIVAPAVPALAMFAVPAGVVIGGIVSYGVAWLFFAPMYFILRGRVAMSFGICIALGAAAGVLASLPAVAYIGAIEFYIYNYYGGLKIACVGFAKTALLLSIFSTISSCVFWLMTKKSAAGVNPHAKLSSSLSVIARSRGLGIFVALVLISTAAIYWWRVSNYQAQEAADSGVMELFERRGIPSPNPIVLQIAPAFRYQSRNDLTGTRSDDKRNEARLTACYPSLTSPRDPANTARGPQSLCSPFSGGGLIVKIGNIRLELDRGKFPTYADAIANRRFNPLSGVKPELAPPAFDAAFDEGWLTLLLKSTEGKTGYSIAAECSLRTPKHFCELFFSLECNPAIGVEVDWWPYERLDEVAELKRRVNEFVSAMVKEPKCQA